MLTEIDARRLYLQVIFIFELFNFARKISFKKDYQSTIVLIKDTTVIWTTQTVNILIGKNCPLNYTSASNLTITYLYYPIYITWNDGNMYYSSDIDIIHITILPVMIKSMQNMIPFVYTTTPKHLATID